MLNIILQFLIKILQNLYFAPCDHIFHNQMRTIIVLLIYVVLIAKVSSTNKAILISSSIGFYNYRQGSNILKIYHHLKSRGFSDQDIILMVPENGKCSLKNSILGSVSFYDGDYSDLGKNTIFDNKHSELKLRNLYDTLTFKYHPFTINRKKITTNQNTNLLIYTSGHGGDDYFKLQEKQAILKEHYKQFTDYLRQHQMYSKILMMSDSCSASTVHEDIVAPNILALGSSSREQKSLSYGFDNKLNSAKSDGFTYYTDMFLNQQKAGTVKQLYEFLDQSKLKVNSKLISTFSRKNTKLKLSEFLNKPKPQIKNVSLNQIKKVLALSKFLLSSKNPTPLSS